MTMNWLEGMSMDHDMMEQPGQPMAAGASAVIIGDGQDKVDETVTALAKDGTAWGITADLTDRMQAEAYQSVAAALGLEPGNICLIASHVWDTIGAGAAGWQTALILREGNAPMDVGPQPDYIGKDLDAIADQLIERYPAPS
jgi:hypothetical protein